jgi:hypothetical protein
MNLNFLEIIDTNGETGDVRTGGHQQAVPTPEGEG